MKRTTINKILSFSLALSIFALGCTEENHDLEVLQATSLQTPTDPIESIIPPYPCKNNFYGEAEWTDGFLQGRADVASNLPCSNYNFIVSSRIANAQNRVWPECWLLGYQSGLTYLVENPCEGDFGEEDDDDETPPPGGGNQ
ncbi:hypothetical protein ABV409_07155 [Flagellimonas sp. DF-77]|uniref:hypothetical protein n=1 Tax=Flagellimonas algarum TaxID=3230298 RepID=UPI0033967686